MILVGTAKLETSGVPRKGCARAPPQGEVSAHPEDDEVVVFRNFFAAGLQFPFDLNLMKILQLLKIKMHQLTPNAFVTLNIYFWVAKTCGFEPSTETFAYMHKVHHQLKGIQAQMNLRLRLSLGVTTSPTTNVFEPVVAYKNKWLED